MASVGVTPPTSVDQAWTWDEFTQVMTRLKKTLPSGKYPFAYNWQGNGVTRWLSLLFQADGRFLQSDLKTPAIASDPGKPRSTSPRASSARASSRRTARSRRRRSPPTPGTPRRCRSPSAERSCSPTPRRRTRATGRCTFAPRKVRGGSDFGGNALVATATTQKASLAAEFLDFVTQADQMKAFCAGASLLPTRKDLTQSGIDFAVRPELAPIFLGQAQQVQPQDAAPGRAAEHVQDHHGAQGPARQGVHRRSGAPRRR